MPRATVADATLSVIPEIFLVKKLLSSESDSALVFTARNLALTPLNATSWALALASLVCSAVTAPFSTWRNLSKVPCRSSFEPTPKPLMVPNDDIVFSLQPQRVPTDVYRLSLLIGRARENLRAQRPGPTVSRAWRRRNITPAQDYRWSRERTVCEAAFACDKANAPACER